MTTYTSREVCSATGLTARQLDHAIRGGYLTLTLPTRGTGRPRLFTRDDVVMAGVYAALLDAGIIPLAAAGIIGRHVDDHVTSVYGPVTIMVDVAAIARAIGQRILQVVT